MDAIKQLCALSVFCGLALSLAPEGSVKKAAGICCAVALLSCLIGCVRGFQTEDYALELARYRELGERMAASAQEEKQRLDRLVIESECEEYILSRAEALGAFGLQVQVRSRWSVEGFWVPCHAVVRGEISPEARAELAALLEAELGVVEEEQEWVNGEG